MTNENNIENVEEKTYTKEKVGSSGLKRKHRTHYDSKSSSSVKKKKKFKFFQNSKERKAAMSLLLAAVIVLLLAIPVLTYLFDWFGKIFQDVPN